MTRIYFDLSMSLDGFVTGPGEGVEKPLGDGGDRLHDWMFGFDVGVEPWGDPPPFHMPVFVITHESRAALPMKGGTTYRFVSDGLEAALRQAKSAAGEKDVGIWGGASVVRQYLAAGLLDEFEIHLVPVLLGEGVRLFEWLGSEPIELERTRTIPTPSATHLRFSVKG